MIQGLRAAAADQLRTAHLGAYCLAFKIQPYATIDDRALMHDQRWPPGACVLFAVVTSLALWSVVILVLSATIG